MAAIVNDLIDRYGIQNIPPILDQDQRIWFQICHHVRYNLGY
jgi:hypothetical protein